MRTGIILAFGIILISGRIFTIYAVMLTIKTRSVTNLPLELDHLSDSAIA